LQKLLQLENLNAAIRIGDIYSIIIEYHASRQRWKQAYAALQEMRETVQESSIKYYINPKVIMAIHKEMNIEYKMPSSNTRPQTSTNRAENANDDDIRDNVGYGSYE
jgi:pentatricopeptide repeat protein